MRLSLTDPRLFAVKTATTVAAAFLLLPLAQFKSDIPSLAYLVGLVVLHVFVLGVYVYRVRVRELDGDVRALVARVVALGVVIYLLLVFSKIDADAGNATVVRNITMVTVLHTVIVALLMVRVGEAPGTSRPPTAEESTAASATLPSSPSSRSSSPSTSPSIAVER